MKYTLFFFVILFTVFKLLFASFTWGSNDVTTWVKFIDHIAVHGIFNIYRNIGDFNHPPLISTYLWLFSQCKDFLGESVPLIIRLPAILADVGSVIVATKILRHLGFTEKEILLRGCLLAASPILLLVSGFHGNTDPVFCFIILL